MSEPREPAGLPEPTEPIESAEPNEPAEPVATAAGGDVATAAAADVAAAAQDVESEQAAEPARPRGRIARFLHLPRSRRGLLILALLVGGFGVVLGVGGMMAVTYSESSGFCSKCHVMAPQFKAYQAGVHRDVACGECHVKPGVLGFVKAKARGMVELYEVATNTYPKPIPAADHADLPPVKDTCLKCHSLKDISKSGGPVKLALRLTYRPDEKNTREQVAVVIRPAGLGQDGADPALSDVRGVHWHVLQKVTFAAADVAGQKVDLVDVTMPDGTTRKYISGPEVSSSSHAAADVTRLERAEKQRTMDCLDCHNRVGHPIPSVDTAVDAAIASGKISADLPYVKRDAVALLSGDYPSVQAADAAIDQLGSRDSNRYPLLLSSSAKFESSVAELKRIYRLVATPAMKVTATTYPDNLGHQSSPGCFRCHDGAHYLVEKGKVTEKTIPSGCATCHTFPQLGPKVAGVLIGGQPESHNNKLFAFDHKKLVTDVNPTGTSCGTCHVPTYCQNCHNSGAIKVRHDEMLYRHGISARTAGVQSCQYCHQPVSCAKCHKDAVKLDRPP